MKASNTAKVVDFQNNSANKLAKQSKSAKGRQRRVITDSGVKVTMSLSDDLKDRMKKAANRFTAIQKKQREHLVELKDIGDVLAELRRLYESDKVFGQEVEKTPLKAISRQDRYVLLQLSNNWDAIQTAIKDGKMKSSTSAKILTDQYRSLTKSDKPTPPKGGKKGKKSQSKTESKSSAKQKTTDETSSQDQTKSEVTENSVAVDLAKIIRQNDLDVDLIFDKVLDILEAKS